MVDVLAHRHEEDVGLVSGLGQAGLLRAEDVADRARVEAVEDRVDRTVAVGVGLAVAGLRQADEGLVGAAPGRVVEVVAVPAELAVARRHVVIPRIVRTLAAHQRLQSVDVGGRVGEGAGDALAIPSVRAGIDRDPRHAARGREGDAVRAVGEDRHAVRTRGRDVVRPVRAGRQFDHVLRAQRADDGVVASVRAEDDAVGRSQPRHVHGVVAGRAVDGDGVEVEAGAGEAADHLDRVAAIGTAVLAAGRRHLERVDADFLDVVEFGHDGTRTRAVAGDDDLGPGSELRLRVAGDL